jgi:hypothetical protein
MLLMLVYWGNMKKAFAFVVTAKEVGLEINVVKNKCLLMSHQFRSRYGPGVPDSASNRND